MNPELSIALSYYFDVTLKKALGYRESYLPPSYDPYEGIIHFGKVGASDDLKDILISNHNVASQLKDNLVAALLPYFEDLKSVSLIFDSDGFGIDVQRGNMQMLNVDPYVIIASKFDNIRDFDSFCRSSREPSIVCRTEEFWRSLLKRVYPQDYKGKYNYEHVYKGYIISINPPLDSGRTYTSRLEDYVNFIKSEQLMDERDLYNQILKSVVQLLDSELFDQIVTYDLMKGNIRSLISRLVGQVKMAIKDNNTRYISNYFEMIAFKDKYALSPDDIITPAVSGDDIVLTLPMWALIYTKWYERIKYLKKEGKKRIFEDEQEEEDENPYRKEHTVQSIDIKNFNLVSAVNAIRYGDISLLNRILQTKKIDFNKFITTIIPQYIRAYKGRPPGEVLQIILKNLDDSHKYLYDTVVSNTEAEFG